MVADSEGWTTILTVSVGFGETFDMQTPGYPPGGDHDKAELNVSGKVMKIPDEADIDFADDHSKATIVNNTDEEWSAGSSVYLYMPGAEISGESLAELAKQVDQNHEDIVSLDARVSALEGVAKATATATGQAAKKK
jgi:hypothetical protein